MLSPIVNDRGAVAQQRDSTPAYTSS